MPTTKTSKQPLHPIYTNVSNVVRALLAMHHMSQQELAERTGMDEGVLSKRISGGSAWRVEEISALAEAFNDEEATFYTDSKTLTTTRQPFRPQPARTVGVTRPRARSTHRNRQNSWISETPLELVA